MSSDTQDIPPCEVFGAVNICFESVTVNYERNFFGTYTMIARMLALAGMLAAPPPAAPIRSFVINNKAPRVDTDGKVIDAHSGNILQFNGTFFLYGDHYKGTVQCYVCALCTLNSVRYGMVDFHCATINADTFDVILRLHHTI